MCLDRVDNAVKRRYGKQKTGYKVFLVNEAGELFPTDQGAALPKPRGKWLHEAHYRTVSYKLSQTRHYRLGFHVC